MSEKANIDELRKILGYFAKGYKVPKIISDIIFDISVREVEDKGKVVLIKRDPNIERGRIQAVRVKIIQDNTVEMHPAIVGKFGADFDGDTMGLYAPVSDEAQNEAKEKMMTSVSNTTMNDPMFEVSKEALTGLFTITHSNNKNQPILIKDVSDAVKLHPGDNVKINFRGKMRNTTAGRVIFNATLPEWYEYVEYDVGNKQLNNIFSGIIDRDREEFRQCIDRVMKLGFEMSTVYPRSISLDMLAIPESIKKLNKDLTLTDDPVKQSTIITNMTKMLMQHLEDNVPHLHEQIKSGAAKGGDQIRQVMVSKGLLTDSLGNLLPVIAKSMNDGYTPEEYFNASHASRKGVADRALATADGGYAYRKMVYVMGNTQCDANNIDCGTRNTLPVKLTSELFKRMGGRYCKVGTKIIPVSKDMIGGVINLRSPIFCRSTNICRKCFGELINQIQTKYCGIVAAQECTSLSEKIMKCSDGLVHYNNHLVPFIDFMNMIKDVDIDIVSGKDKNVNVYSIDTHHPTDKMLFISTKSGHTLVCQSNHPLWIKLNNLHSKYPNRTCRLIGDQTYSTTGSGRSKGFQIDDNELIQIEAGNLQKHDAIWVDTSIALNRNSSIIPEIDGYVVGFYLGDGFTLGNKKDTYSNGFGISQQCNSYRDYLIEKCSTVGKVLDGSDNYIVVSYKEDEKLYGKIINGNRSWNKRLMYNFLDYDCEWLRNCLAGLIDSDGTVFYNTCSLARIYTGSYYLVQQIKAICVKLGYKCYTNLVSCSNEGLGEKHKRPHFSVDVSFYEGSIIPNAQKFSNHDIKYIQRMKDDKPIKGFDVIKCIKEMPLWKYPVFDIKTETSEYMLGFVQNHNSFHTGGIISLDVPDMMPMLSENVEDSLKPTVSKLFKQDDFIMRSNSQLMIMKIDSNIYKGRYDISKEIINDDIITLPVGHFELDADGVTLPITIEKSTKVFVIDKEINEGVVVLTYGKGDPMFELGTHILSAQETARMIDQYIGGKSPWKDPTALFTKFFKLLSPYGGWDTVHLEVIISAILRNKKNPQHPARIVHPYDPVTYSIKKLPGVMSWPLGVAFENFGSAITRGLISDRAPESAIEKVLFGEPLSDLGIEGQKKDRKKKRR